MRFLKSIKMKFTNYIRQLFPKKTGQKEAGIEDKLFIIMITSYVRYVKEHDCSGNNFNTSRLFLELAWWGLSQHYSEFKKKYEKSSNIFEKTHIMKEFSAILTDHCNNLSMLVDLILKNIELCHHDDIMNQHLNGFVDKNYLKEMEERN